MRLTLSPMPDGLALRTAVYCIARQGITMLSSPWTEAQHQQNIATLPFGIILLRAPSNRLIHLRPLAPAILATLTTLAPGELRIVGP
jgi:hypothetical protein